MTPPADFSSPAARAAPGLPAAGRRPSRPRRRASLRLAALLALVVSTGAPLPAAESSGFLPDTEVLARAGDLSVDERRYLVYLYARLNRPKVAERLADGLLAADPRDRQTLLVLASMYLEQKDAAATLRTARRFLAAYPGDQQGLYFLATGHFLAREYAESHRLLRELKRTQFADTKFPYETDLASSAYSAGDWYRAMLAYQRLLRHHDLGDQLRDEVRRALDGIYREHLPRLDLAVQQTRLDRAEVRRTQVTHGAHLHDRRWLDLRYARDAVDLEDAPGLVASRRIREEFSAHHAMLHDGRWRTEAWLGHSGSGGFGGGRVHYTFARQREVSLEAAGGLRATDSLTLESLDGRQRQFAAVVTWLIEADLTLILRAHVREIRLAGQSLGRGSGLDVNLDYTLWRQGPRVVVGYRGTIGSFTPDAAFDAAVVAPIADPDFGAATRAALAANLVSRRLNRHGAGLLVTDNLADAWVYRLTAGVDYDFELSATGWNSALGLAFWPRKSVELNAEAGYTSSATGSNAGSAATLFNVSARILY